MFELLRVDWAPGSSTGSNSSYPAKVFASSFDAFVEGVLAELPALNLPVVTGAWHTVVLCAPIGGLHL